MKNSDTDKLSDIYDIDMNVSLAPAMAMASLYQNLAWSMGQQAMQAVQAQQQTTMLFQSVTARSCWQLSQYSGNR
jgi:hypothetical protein